MPTPIQSRTTTKACFLLLGQLLLCLFAVKLNAQEANVNCATELDSAVALASHSDMETEGLASRFALLEETCPDFAQISHNRGVLAGRENRWSEAISHFERSLKKDTRAAETHQHLQQIFDYRAAIAYAKALGTTTQISEPALHFQDSSDQNSPKQNPNNPQLHDIVTVEYELFAWWQAVKSGNGIDEHYIDGYDSGAISLARQAHAARQWQSMKREIAFTRQDAVVVLSDSSNAHTLLLLRLIGNRWKVYQETTL